jgi:hypothetical protein
MTNRSPLLANISPRNGMIRFAFFQRTSIARNKSTEIPARGEIQANRMPQTPASMTSRKR